ncbi:MAG: AAA family ATPase [Candidatus Zixiibacteriota bacterium]
MSYPYISRIEVTNFRNLAAFEVDISNNTVVVGENRSGKSNLLHALRLVLDPSLSDAARVLRAEDFWDGLDAPFGGHKISVKVFVRGFKKDKSVRATLADCVIKESPLTALLTFEFRPRASIEAGEGPPAEEDYEFVVYGGKDDKHRVGRDVRQWLSLFMLPAERDAEEYVYSARHSPLRKLLARIRPQLDAAVLDDVRKRLDDAAAGLLAEKPLEELQKKINERIEHIVGPLHAVKTKFDFASSDPEQLVRGLRLFLEEEQTRGLGDASLGTLNIIYLTLLLQELDERRDAQDLAGMIVAIEEPEAHLHPHLQRLLFRYALQREHSLLVATHSPHIASVAPLRAIVALRAGKDGTTARQVPADLDDQVAKDLERYLDVTRAELLFAKGIVFVEGPSEQYLVPAFARREIERQGLGHDLDEYGISVCSVNGTDFAPYWYVTDVKSWDIPRVVITDGDPKPPRQGNSYFRGLFRGARLLEDANLEKSAKSGTDDDGVRAALDKTGIFVGQRELELDLVHVLAGEMKETYEELRGYNLATKRFEAAIDAFGGGDEDAGADVVSRIEAIGKGRYAQRLADKITADHEPPAYLRDAITRIVNLVRGNG